MNIDIRTIIIILGVTHFIQVLVFYLQFKVNNLYNGVGWWLLWSIAEIVGFTSILFRGIPGILPIIIIVQNTSIVLGTLFLYIGVRRFFNKDGNLKVIIPIFALFEFILLYFLFANDDIQIRSFCISLTIATISFLTVLSLFQNTISTIKTTVNFNAFIFIVHGCVFLIRTIMIISGADVHNVLTPNLINILPYFDALVVSLFWTFGFIIMVNQRQYAEMNKAKNDFEIIYNAIPDMVLITKISDGSIIEVNKGFTTISGYARNEVIGKSTVDFLWKNPEDRQKVVSILQQNKPCENIEATFLRKDGTEFYGLIFSKIITVQEKLSILSITRDITDQKEKEKKITELNEKLEEKVETRTKELKELVDEQSANQIALLNLVEDLNEKTDQLQLTSAQLQAANKELEAFSYSVSHDLRAPLRHINGFIDLFTDHFSGSIPEKGINYLNIIRDSSKQMGKLIDDLLGFSRTGRHEIRKSMVDMNVVYDDAFKSASQDSGDRKINWVNSNLPSVYCDQSLIKQVWINLLSNAVKFTLKKSDPKIETGYNENEKYFVFFVRDNGVGFDMKYANKLFGVFQRLHSKTEFEGTGIGLANVQRIIVRHGGTVWAEAEQEKGATFYFTLPKLLEEIQ